MSSTPFTTPAERKCRCGHTKDHPMIIPEREYTLWGWILLSMFGMTPRPIAVIYRCGACRQSLGSTRDPKILSGEVRADPNHKGAVTKETVQSVPASTGEATKNAEH